MRKKEGSWRDTPGFQLLSKGIGELNHLKLAAHRIVKNYALEEYIQ